MKILNQLKVFWLWCTFIHILILTVVQYHIKCFRHFWEGIYEELNTIMPDHFPPFVKCRPDLLLFIKIFSILKHYLHVYWYCLLFKWNVTSIEQIKCSETWVKTTFPPFWVTRISMYWVPGNKNCEKLVINYWKIYLV